MVSHCVCPSVCQFFVSGWYEFLPNLVCASILWRSGFGLLMGKFRQILTEFIFLRRNNGGVLTFLYFVLYSIAQTCFQTCTKWPDWDHPCMHNISSEPLLMILLANSEGPEQTAWMRRLIWAFAVCICPKTRFCMVRPRWCNMSQCMTKPTKWHVHLVKTQISPGIRPVWSESSLCAKWKAKSTSRCPGWSEPSLRSHAFL